MVKHFWFVVCLSALFGCSGSLSLAPFDFKIVSGSGLNHHAEGNAQYPTIVAHNSKIYVVWKERELPHDSNSNFHIRAKVYNGDHSSPAWTSVDGGGFLGLDNEDFESTEPTALSFGGKLYVAWGWNGTMRLKVYNDNDSAPGWTDLSASVQSAAQPTKVLLAELNGKLYMVTSESGELHAQVFNGNLSSPSWAYVDGGQLNYLGSEQALYPFAGVANGKLYVTWMEKLASGSEAFQIRIRVYNGNDSSPAWAFLDGGGTTGLNYNTDVDGEEPSFIAYNNKLYIGWREDPHPNGKGKVRVKVFNGNESSPAWAFVDGGGTNGLTSETGDGYTPRFVVFSDRLFVAWWELDGGYHIKLHVFSGDDATPSWGTIPGEANQTFRFAVSEFLGYPHGITLNGAFYLVWMETKNLNRWTIHVAAGAPAL